jgi:hypothetical protein
MKNPLNVCYSQSRKAQKSTYVHNILIEHFNDIYKMKQLAKIPPLNFVSAYLRASSVKLLSPVKNNRLK